MRHVPHLSRTSPPRHVELGLPPFILDAFDEKPLPHNLDLSFGYPYQVLDHPQEQSLYGRGRITPISYDHDLERTHDEFREIAELTRFQAIEPFLGKMQALNDRRAPHEEYVGYIQSLIAELADAE